MSAQDKAAKARARMDQVRREMAERRALRARNGAAASARARKSLLAQGPVAEQVAKHLGELGRRRRQAGGWATEKTERDKDYVLGFGEEENAGFRHVRRPPAETRPGGIGSIEDDEAESARAPEPAAPPPPPPPPAPEAPAARQVRRPAPIDDEDDFSNQSSWMRKQ
jgi:hypothetical protein